jgi:outer membrane protein assembly factor BamB
MTRHVVVRGLLCAGLLAGARVMHAQWPQFRGPDATGVAASARLPETWSRTVNIRWRTEIPGVGWSSPVVSGNTVFLTSVIRPQAGEPPKPGLYFGGERPAPTDEHRWVVLAVDLESGAIRWQREVHRGAPPQSRHLKNSYASETPTTDGTRVYALFGNLGVFAYAMDGTLAWERRRPARATRYGWGTAASPVLHNGRLYVLDDNEEDASLMALDARTGTEVWRVSRPKETNWATPFIWRHAQRTEIVIAATGGVQSYDLEGRVLWTLRGMSSIAIPTPFESGGLLYVASGYVGDKVRPVYAIKPGAAGDISLTGEATSNQFVAWTLPQAAPYNPSPIVYDGVFYTLLDRGFLTAHDARTGREVYGRQRIDPVSAGFTASPWAANGRIYLLNEDGDTYVVRAGPTFEVLAKNSLGEMAMATPAIAGNSLIVRTASALYRVGGQ